MLKKTFKIVLIIFMILLPVNATAQKKQISKAKDYLKSGKDLDKGEALLRQVLSDSAQAHNMKAWQLLFETVKAQYEAGNEQMYLKQKYDTLTFFNTALKLFKTGEKMDSVDALPDEDGDIKPKYRSKNAQYLKTIIPNIYYGGIMFVNKKEYKQAYNFFDHFIAIPSQPLFKGQHLKQDSKMIVNAAYWTMYCGFKLDSAEMIMKHHELAEKDTAQLPFIYQYESEAYSLKGEKDKYVSLLRDGFKKYPKFPYFFPRLIDYYTENNMPDSALALAERAIEIDSTSLFYRYAKSSVLLNTGRYEECIAICKELIKEDENMADAYYNAGLAYYNMAIDLDKEYQPTRRKRQRILKLYKTALPYLEKYRKLAPDRQDNWLSPLYTIYLNLNMGKKFDEIDKLRNEYKRNHK